VEAVRNCLGAKNFAFAQLFRADNMVSFLQRQKQTKQEVWALVMRHCNTDIMQQAATLVYHSPNLTDQEITDGARLLPNTQGSYSFFGSGDAANTLNATLVDADGGACQGNFYMRAACSLVVINGVVTPLFTHALVSERRKFCTNRIRHIEASLLISTRADEAPSEAEFRKIAHANEELAKDTFGSKGYLAKHDLEHKQRSKKRSNPGN
jgi:hypothetical protein